MSPNNIQLLVGIPLNEDDFIAQMKDPRSHARIYQQMHGARALEQWRIFTAITLEQIASLNGLGVSIDVSARSSKDMAKMSRGSDVTILISHYADGEGFQLGDQYVNPAVWAAEIGNDYIGVLDLAACGSADAAVAIMRPHLPHVRFVSKRGETHGTRHLAIVQATLKAMKIQGKSYIDAMEMVLGELFGVKNEETR